MPTYISLLRGINVGGNKKIKMAELRALYESLGFDEVRSLLQSGNVIFTSAEQNTETLIQQIETAIKARYDFEVTVIIRSPAQIQTIAQNHPFSDEQLEEPRKLLVTFLAQPITDDAFNALIAAHTGPETIHQRGQELYIFYPNGMGRSKLDNKLIERHLGVLATGRNWNTVNKLASTV